MIAEAQCRIRADGKQRFRFYAAGGMGACIGWQALDLPIAPATQATYVTDLSPHWQGYCWSPFKVVMMPGSGCTAGSCNYTFQFGTPVYACPAGTVRGDTLERLLGRRIPLRWCADQCFTLTAPDAEAGCPGGSTTIYDDAGTHCALPAGSATLVGASGWSLPLSFVQPTMEQHEIGRLGRQERRADGRRPLHRDHGRPLRRRPRHQDHRRPRRHARLLVL
jgi:conjugal transfer mating pair stabilization protein TraN